MKTFKQFLLEMPVIYTHISKNTFDYTQPFPAGKYHNGPRAGTEIKLTSKELRDKGYRLFHTHDEGHNYHDAYHVFHGPTKQIHFRVQGYREGKEFTDALVQKHPTADVGINMGHVYRMLLDHNKKVITDNVHSKGMRVSMERHVISNPELAVHAHHDGNDVGKVTQHNIDDYYVNRHSKEPGNSDDVGYSMRFHITKAKKNVRA